MPDRRSGRDAAPPEAVGPLMRGIGVLRELALAGGRAGLGDLVRATGLARSTVDRVAATLERVGYARLEGREVVLTPRLMELGNAYLAATGLPDRLAPLADQLADTLDESVSLAVPDADGVRFVHQAIRRRTMALAFRIGDLVPAERAAPGALFAAEWGAGAWAAWRARRAADPEDAGFPAVPAPVAGAEGEETFVRRTDAARETGWSVDDQLIESGLIAIAVPVHDRDGRRVCAVSVVSHTSRHSADSLRDAALNALRETAAAMEAVLATPSAPPPPPPAPDATASSTAAALRASKHDMGPEFVESLARGLAVVAAFDTGGAQPSAGLPLTAVADATGLPRATARRALLTLEYLGYAACEDGLFRLTPRVLDLGFAHLSSLTLPEIAAPHLAELVCKVGESASVAVLDEDDVRYVARVPTVRIMSVAISVGTRFPAYATSLGRVLLADLPNPERRAYLDRLTPAPLTRHTVTSKTALARLLDASAADGFSLVDEELEEGLRSLAVPLRDASGRAVAALNVSMHTSRRTAAEAESELLPAIRESAANITGDLAAASRYGRPEQ